MRIEPPVPLFSELWVKPQIGMIVRFSTGWERRCTAVVSYYGSMCRYDYVMDMENLDGSPAQPIGTVWDDADDTILAVEAPNPLSFFTSKEDVADFVRTLIPKV